MNAVDSSGPRPRHALSPLYVAMWTTLAALALAYLALMVVRPEIAEGLLMRVPIGAPEDNRGQRAMAQLAAEVRDLKQTVKALETEVSDLRLVATATERTNVALLARLSTVENGLKSVIGPQSRLSAGLSDAPSKAPNAPAVAGFVEERLAARKGDAAKASIAAAAGRSPQVANGPPIGVQIASAPSVDALRLSWQLMQEGHKSIVRGLEPRFVETPGDHTAYKLIAGPVASEDDAAKLCEKLRTRRIACSVAPFGGKPL